MSLIHDHDQRALEQTVRRFVSDRTPIPAVREVAFGDRSYDPHVWHRLAEGIGLAGLVVPEALGGSGGTHADLAVAFRELGAGLVPSPLLASAVLAAGSLLALDDEAFRAEWLPRIASGVVVGTLAVSEKDERSWIPSSPATTATSSSEGATVTGTKVAVVNGADADLLLVQAAEAGGTAVYAVERGAPGLTVTPERCLDATRSVATVVLDGTPARRVAGDAAASLDHVADMVNLAVAAEQVGAMRACIDMTVEYAKIRYSFGQPIGAYQGVKHKLADMYTDWSLADAAVRRAAESSTRDGAALPAAAAAARTLASASYVNAAKQTMLLHGGIGFTWEHDAHLYYKNAVTHNVLFGGPEYQELRLADKLGV